MLMKLKNKVANPCRINADSVYIGLLGEGILLLFIHSKLRFLKKISRQQKSMQNYPACKELNSLLTGSNI